MRNTRTANTLSYLGTCESFRAVAEGAGTQDTIWSRRVNPVNQGWGEIGLNWLAGGAEVNVRGA